MYTRKNIFIIIGILTCLAIPICAHSQEESKGLPKLIVFYSPSCHRCIEAKNEVMPEIEKEFKERIFIEYRDITDIENYKLMLSLKQTYQAKDIKDLPIFYLASHFLDGRGDIKNKLKGLIAGALNIQTQKQALSRIDLIAHFKTFKPLTIISAGLIDGINPCAFTVIVFFISFLSLQGYKKRELIIVGFSFLWAVFLTYLLVGLGIFNFLYRLKGFWLVSRIVNISVGIFSIILGILAIYDFFKFKNTHETEGLFLQLPKAVKNRIHYIIGLHYRKTKETKAQEQALQKPIFRLVIITLITGFLVSILEAICTGQVYLPTITFILQTTALKLRAGGYLLLYNLMFILPLLIIFLFALLGVTSEQFSHFLKRYLLMVKLLMAILFFSLGIFLISLSFPQISWAQNQTTLSEKQKELEDPYTWDFGQIKEGEILKHAFVLKNESQNTLKIKDITTSCGCTVSQVKKKMLLPGETTLIGVRFNSKGYSGATQQFVYVHTDSLDSPIIRYIIKAEVVK